MTNRRKVAYFYDDNIGNYHYAAGHPMKPHRIRMTHNLIINYGLYRKLLVQRPTAATRKQMTKFHTDEYVDFLHRVTPSTQEQFPSQCIKFNVGDDCPVFDGLYEFCSLSAGGSIDSALKLNRGEADIAVNWGGGLHHAKRGEASGFCYVNDIVLAILELLRYHSRVLYLDIDIHHGDGVEEAFYTTDRVMTCSFHKYGQFFPGTGDLGDKGYGRGKYYAVNVPLKDGINDETYKSLFEPIVGYVMEWYRPGAVVLQCGADSLAGDKLGCFNLSMHGHASCLNYVKTFNVPILVLGGGGYTIRNVARAWTFETAQALGETLDTNLPFNDYFQYYGPEYKLDVPSTNMQDQNTEDYLGFLRQKIVENLKHLAFAPSVQMTETPPDEIDSLNDSDASEEEITNERRTVADRYIVPPNEYYDSDEADAAFASRMHPQNRQPFKGTDFRRVASAGSVPQS